MKKFLHAPALGLINQHPEMRRSNFHAVRIFSCLLLLEICITQTAISQTEPEEADSTSESDSNVAEEDSVPNLKPELLNSGFIDVMNNGQVNASARIIRLYIGEPGKFAVPLSLYTGVSANNFQNRSSTEYTTNEQLANSFINPLSGLVNLSSDGILYFKPSKKITRTGLSYQLGERILTGYRTEPNSEHQTGLRPVNFLNSFGTVGLYFQTGAWEKDSSSKPGIFWISMRYIGCYSSPSKLKDFLPEIKTKGIYTGYSIGFGIEINNVVNVKVFYYKYTNQPETDYYMPLYQFSFNYCIKNK